MADGQRGLWFEGSLIGGFRLQVFAQISLPLAHEYSNEAISNFNEIRGDIGNFVFTAGVSDTGEQLITGVIDTGHKHKAVVDTGG